MSETREPIHDAHDKLFKTVFARLENAAALIRALRPAPATAGQARRCFPRRLLVLTALVIAALGCRASVDGFDVDTDRGWPQPRGDLVPAVGTAHGIDMATWNLENFPADATTPERVADLIAWLELDLIAVQEIADVAAFDELMARLPAHDGLLSDHMYMDGEYQKVGVIYRIDVLAPVARYLLFTDDGYSFPRPPLAVHFEVVAEGPAQGLDFLAIAVHLKAGSGDSSTERRRRAMTLLERHVREMVDGPGDDDVIVLGDFNEPLDTAASQKVWAPVIDQPDRYTVHTAALQDSAFSFLPGQLLLDHVVTTTALADQLADSMTVIPRLDQQIGGYDSSVSDHLPVIVQMPGALQ